MLCQRKIRRVRFRKKTKTMLLQNICNRPFCIYGAGIVASSVYTAIKTLYNKEPLFFLVSDSRGNGAAVEQVPPEIDGIPVRSLAIWKHELQIGMFDSNIPEYYLIATPEAHHPAITDLLRSMEEVRIKDSQLILFTNSLENELMEAFYSSLSGHTTILNLLSSGQVQEIGEEEKYCGENLSESCMEIFESENSSVRVYQAESHMDKSLCGEITRMSYIHPIQVGAVLTEQKIVDLQDNQGDNISAKNRNYCELTATYYVWKHSRAKYKGICHYRRVFDISDEQMRKLLERDQEWDVILPYPSIHYPDISAQHVRYVTEGDWKAMLQALKDVAPEYLNTYARVVSEEEHFFNNFNMLIAKSSVFDDYCSFLFSVLERTEELTTPKGWERADRFAGYLGENLTTLYFLHNRDKWKITYAGKIWMK